MLKLVLMVAMSGVMGGGGSDDDDDVMMMQFNSTPVLLLCFCL